MRKSAEWIVADVIDLNRFFGKTVISPDKPSPLIAQSRVEDASDEAEAEECVIAFAGSLPIDYETLTDNDLRELATLAIGSERFRAILRKLTIAVSR